MARVELTHGEVRISINIDGVDAFKQKPLFDSAFQLFLNSLGVDKEETIVLSEKEKVLQEVENAYMETFKSIGQDKLDEKSVEEEILKVAEKIASSKPKTTIELLEEKLKTLNPRTYRKIADGRYSYQCYYKCECGNKGKHYIERNRLYISCHDCQKRMKVKQAREGKFPSVDTFGNFFVAGNFVDNNTIDNNIDEEKVYTFKLEQEMAESTGEDRPNKLQIK